MQSTVISHCSSKKSSSYPWLISFFQLSHIIHPQTCPCISSVGAVSFLISFLPHWQIYFCHISLSFPLQGHNDSFLCLENPSSEFHLLSSFTSFSFQIKFLLLKDHFYYYPMENSPTLPQVILHFIAWFIFFLLLIAIEKCLIYFFVYLLIFVSSHFPQFQIESKLHERQAHCAFQCYLPNTQNSSHIIGNWWLFIKWVKAPGSLLDEIHQS